MSKPALRNPFRPAPGSSITVEPIRNLRAIIAIKKNLRGNLRNLCLFTFGINTAYRAGEILSLRIKQVSHLGPGERLNLKQGKNKAYRDATLNHSVVSSLQAWLAAHPCPVPDAPLFLSQRGNASICVSTLNHLVKDWCDEIGLVGNYGSHSLRKTWGYQQLRGNAKTPPHLVMPILMEAYGHATQRQTLQYLCIQPDEVASLFMEMEL